MSAAPTTRVVFVSNNPFPYHTPILNDLARRVHLHVVYMADRHPLGSFSDVWGESPSFDHSFHGAKAVAIRMRDLRFQLSVGVSARLSRLSPDVILFSSWGPLVIEPLIWKTLARRRAVMWAESTRWSGLTRDRLSQTARRAVVSRCDAFVSDGSQAARFVRDLGAEPARIVTSCLPSVPHLPQGHHPRRVGGIRFLFVGRLIPQKRPVELVRAFASIALHSPGASLTVVGDGPLGAEVAAVAADLGDRVCLRGRLEGEDLGIEYARADVLVIPAVREVWGLVVNEALAAGLYVIATDQVGSAHDLLDPVSGEIVPAGDDVALAAAMERAARVLDRGLAARAARRARVAGCTPTAFATAIVRAVELALNGPTVQASP